MDSKRRNYHLRKTYRKRGGIFHILKKEEPSHPEQRTIHFWIRKKLEDKEIIEEDLPEMRYLILKIKELGCHKCSRSMSGNSNVAGVDLFGRRRTVLKVYVSAVF